MKGRGRDRKESGEGEIGRKKREGRRKDRRRVERERVEDGRDTGKETPIKPHPPAHS